jgi:hypothetical protein
MSVQTIIIEDWIRLDWIGLDWTLPIIASPKCFFYTIVQSTFTFSIILPPWHRGLSSSSCGHPFFQSTSALKYTPTTVSKDLCCTLVQLK